MERKCTTCNGTGTLIGEADNGRILRDGCPTCGGNGINPNYRRTVCLDCRAPIGYHKNQGMIPNYCPTCKQKHRANQAELYTKRTQYIAPDRTKKCSGLDGRFCDNEVQFSDSWTHIPTLCKECREELETKKILGARFYEASMIPEGWEASIIERAVMRWSGLLVFQAKGTNGADYVVSWNKFGVAKWQDTGLPPGHELRIRDPR